MKTITKETEQRLMRVIPRIMETITGVPAATGKYVFYRDSFCSRRTNMELIVDYEEKGENVALMLLASTFEKLGVSQEAMRTAAVTPTVVVTVSTVDGWFSVIWNGMHNTNGKPQIITHAISDNDLACLEQPGSDGKAA